MKIYSAKAAKTHQVFFVNHNGDIQETSLFDHVMQSLDTTTSPRGVMPEMFYEQNRRGEWELKMWGVRGPGPAKILDTFKTEEEAEDSLYSRVYAYDFQIDDLRDTQWFKTREAAQQHINELYSDTNNG